MEGWRAGQLELMDFQYAVPGASTALWIKLTDGKVAAMLLRYADDFLIAASAKLLRTMEVEFGKRMSLKGGGFGEVRDFAGAQYQIGRAHV